MASSVWKGHLTFGLVSFPIRLFSAARSETISFNLLHKPDHSRIKQVIFCQAEEKAVPRQGDSLAHDVLSGRDPASRRVPHRHEPGERERTRYGQDADHLARSRI